MSFEQRQPDPLSALALARATGRYAHQVATSLQLAARRWQLDDASSMAAAVAYYLALSVFPMLLLLTSGLGLFLRFTNLGHDAEVQLLALVAEHCSPTLETQVRSLVVQLEDQSVLGCPSGLVMAILAAIGVFYQFERAFDKIWRIPTPSHRSVLSAVGRLLTQRLTAFLMLTVVGLALAAILVSNLAIGVFRQWMADYHLPGTVAVMLLDMLATMTLNCLAFAMVYRFLPKRRVRWRDALRSGLLVAIVWEAGRQLLAVFLIGMRYTTAYGAIGSFIALLLWFYWGVTILLFGAEYMQVLSRRHRRPLPMFAVDGSSPVAGSHSPRLAVRVGQGRATRRPLPGR